MHSAHNTQTNIFRQYRQLPATVHLLCVGSFINRVGSFVMLFLSIYVSEELELGADFASYCIGAFGCGSVISALIGGQLADQFGRRRTMLLALFGGSRSTAAPEPDHATDGCS
jgi:MFS family permease